ncbi:unnamed protein product [Periconia digitata]|uniref:Uncharacterized protein n=1 Tax=Periconia digitata TaxID=1303443 RepID=A0A9W4UQ60_9PLEO|nr:unnamed protein product [Periconia digitata]
MPRQFPSFETGKHAPLTKKPPLIYVTIRVFCATGRGMMVFSIAAKILCINIFKELTGTQALTTAWDPHVEALLVVSRHFRSSRLHFRHICDYGKCTVYAHAEAEGSAAF